MNQSNLVTSRDRIFLCTPRFAIQHAVASLLHGYLDQFLQQRVSACRRDFRVFTSDGVFDNHSLKELRVNVKRRAHRDAKL